MLEISRVGAVDVEYSHFTVGESWEPGFERQEGRQDSRHDEAVLAGAGQIVMRSRMQEHTALVALALADEASAAPGGTWEWSTAVDYRPVYAGRMTVSAATNGPAGPAHEPLEVFGQMVEPGEPSLRLDPARTYRVQVLAQGRRDSAEKARTGARGYGLPHAAWLEAYLIVFNPVAVQEPPAPTAEESRRSQLTRLHGKPPLNMRCPSP